MTKEKIIDFETFPVPGIRLGVACAGIKKENGTIGVIATAGTVSSNGYVDAINKWSKQLNYMGQISVIQQAGIGLAGDQDEQRRRASHAHRSV